MRVVFVCASFVCASSRGADLKPTAPQRLTWSFRVLYDITEPSSVRSTKI